MLRRSEIFFVSVSALFVAAACAVVLASHGFSTTEKIWLAATALLLVLMFAVFDVRLRRPPRSQPLHHSIRAIPAAEAPGPGSPSETLNPAPRLGPRRAVDRRKRQSYLSGLTPLERLSVAAASQGRDPEGTPDLFAETRARRRSPAIPVPATGTSPNGVPATNGPEAAARGRDPEESLDLFEAGTR